MSQMTAVNECHIERDERGRAWVRGTGMRVSLIMVHHIAWGMSPERIHEGFRHLTLGQVYAAFAYYYDHKAEIDAELADDERYANEFFAAQGESPMAKKWRERNQK